MWFDGIRKPNTIYVASVSRGKDSTAMLEAIKLMGWPLDMLVSVDIWFDEETPAELPPMVAFKDEWDKKCLETFGVPVTRVCAQKGERADAGKPHSRESYTSYFYRRRASGDNIGSTVGFPMQRGSWCKKLKYEQVDLQGHILQAYEAETAREERELEARTPMPQNDGQKINIVYYIGIAADEPKRIAKHMPKKDMVMPLIQIGWEEELCGLVATYLDMLAPTYNTSMRDGCWFCHNQGVAQLRSLRHNYPELWEKLMRLDLDSPVTFHADGHTVHDFDRRFQLEDEGLIDPTKTFRWTMLDDELNFCLW